MPASINNKQIVVYHYFKDRLQFSQKREKIDKISGRNNTLKKCRIEAMLGLVLYNL